MASELEFRMWLEALVRQNEQEPLGYPERLELESQLLHAFLEAKAQEKRAWDALHNQIESQKDDWEKAITSLRKASEADAAMRTLLERFAKDERFWNEIAQAWDCLYCRSTEATHRPDCPIAQARAFLSTKEDAGA